MSDKSLFLKQILELETLLLEAKSILEFPQLVSNTLSQLPALSFNGAETIQECLHLQKTVPQYYGPREFGKFNLTLVNNSSFFIIVMYMDDIGTEIHDHPFTGCFIPLIGNPYEIKFKYQIQSSFSDRLDFGELELVHSQLIQTHQPVEINKDSIHLLVRPNGGQFSLLIAKILPKEQKQNHFYYYPGLRVKNRTTYNSIPKSLAHLNSGTLVDFEASLKNIEPDELLRLYQLIRQRKNIAEISIVEKIISDLHPKLKPFLHSHDAYMSKLHLKLK